MPEGSPMVRAIAREVSVKNFAFEALSLGFASNSNTMRILPVCGQPRDLFHVKQINGRLAWGFHVKHCRPVLSKISQEPLV